MRITDVISEEQCLSWKQNDYVMITAPTGSGKTHFILKRLLPLAIQNNRRILYLCNRLLVLEQTKVAAEADGIQFEELDGCFVSQYFSIATYQKIEHKRSFELEKTEHFGNNGNIFNDAYYCVFDEAHYFVHDAAFNENTHQVLEYLNRYNVYIGMTATDEPVKMHLSNHSVHDFLYGLEQKTMAYAKDRTYKQQQAQDIESHGYFDEETQMWSWLDTDSYGRPCLQKMPQSQFEELKNPSSLEWIDQAVSCLKPMDYPESWKVISLPDDYSSYHVYYYHTDDELLRRIEQTPEEKWLIFSMNSEAGIELTEQINQFLHADNAAVFLDSALIHTKSTSNSERRARRIQRAKNTYCEIRDTWRFSCRVLVTTTVLDNGVNLHDRALRHIVLPTHDKTEFMQMIGRKRLAEGETANLYIQETAYKTIAQERYSVQRDMQHLQNFLKLNETKEITSHRNPLGYATRFQIKYPGDQIRQIMAFMRKCKRPLLINAEFRYGSSEADSYENRVKRLRDWKINQLAFCNLLYSLKLCSDFRACRNSAEPGTPQYEHPVLWSQLQWLGKEYDPTCWLDYEVRKEARETLQKQLLADCEKGYFIEGAAALEAYIGDLIKLLDQINGSPGKRKVGLRAVNNMLLKNGLCFQIGKDQFMRHRERKYYYRIEKIEI